MTKQQFDFSVDVMQCLIWQYNDATKLQSIVENKQAWLDTNWRDFWDDWYVNVFDLRTANSFGISVWAKILGMQFATSDESVGIIFSFDGGGQTFDNGSFVASDSIALTLEQKRTILQLRYRQMTTGGSIDDMYYAISTAFPGGNIIDNLDMSLTVVLSNQSTSLDRYILDTYDILPRPAAVKLSVYSDTNLDYRGFDDTSWQNFDNGSFGA